MQHWKPVRDQLVFSLLKVTFTKQLALCPCLPFIFVSGLYSFFFLTHYAALYTIVLLHVRVHCVAHVRQAKVTRFAPDYIDARTYPLLFAPDARAFMF